MNTIFYFIRHGKAYNPQDVVYGRTDVHLTYSGHQKVGALAQKIKNDGVVPSVIFTSPMERTIETSSEIEKVFPGVPVIVEQDLEEVDTSGLTGKPNTYVAAHGDVYTNSVYQDLNIESQAHVLERMTGVMIRIRSQYEGKTVFVVSHADPICFLLWSLVHPGENLPPMTEIKKYQYLERGEAFRMVIDDQNKLVNNEFKLIAP